MRKPLLLAAILSVATTLLMAQPTPVSFTNRSTLLTGGVGNGTNDCAVDMNGDYLDDVVRVTNSGLGIYFQRPNQTFSYNFFPVNFNNSPNWSICAADLDGNGFNDLLFGGGSAVSFVMASSDGSGYSEDRIPDYIFSQRSTFFDIDNDGDLDAFVCHDVDLSHPYRNDGQGHMVEDQNLIHTVNLPGNYAAIWVDYNNDGLTDLYITKCRGGSSPGDPSRTNGMYRNNGDGTFTEVGAEINMDDNAQSWATVFEDFDNDGDFDAFIVNHDFQNRFMLNDGTGMFTDIIETTGIDANDLGAWENASGDFNNDGFIDILSELGDELYLNNGDLTFTGQNLPFDEGGIGDFNNDGFLDVINGSNLWINDGNDNNWIKFNTQGLISNRNGIGSRVEIYGAWGRQIREVRAGQSFSPMSSLTTHFGLGQATAIDSVVVTWPSGVRTVLENPAINITHTLLEASCLLAPATIGVLGSTTLCEGETVQLIAPEGFDNIRWSNGDTDAVLEVSEPGIYGLVLFDADGCASIAQNVTVTRSVDVAPVIEVEGELTFCAGDVVTLRINSGNNPVWSNGATGTSISVTESGVYNVVVDALCAEEGIPAAESVTVIVGDAAAPVVENVEVDGTGVAMLTVSGENIEWYDVAEGGESIGSGNTLITPALTEDATYYAEASQRIGGEMEAGGKLTTDGNGGVPSVGAYSYFDAYQPFTIRTVDILVPNGQTPGVRTIQLYNGNEQLMASRQVDVVLGLQTIELDFEVPVGTEFSLRCVENNLFRNNGGVNYPYPIGSVGALTGSFYGDSYYYYFYNWQVQLPMRECTSERVPVPVTLVHVETLPEVGQLTLFPNPVRTNLRLEMDVLESAKLELSLLNALGQVVLQQPLGNLNAGTYTHDMDVSRLPAGMYQLQLRQGNRVMVRKVVVQ